MNSTFTGNSSANGAGITSGAGATVEVTDSTIASNLLGTGLHPIGALLVRSTIVSGQVGGNCAAPVTSLGRNLDSAATCGFTATGDASNTNPNLGALAANGGPTLTMKPAAGSPAIGTSACVTASDQRGTSRPQGGACDKGAVEQ